MISEDQLRKVAKLARLELTDEELAIYPRQFSAILGYFEKIAKIDTQNVEPLITPSDMEQHWRDDQVVAWESGEVAVANAPEKSGHLFKVPPVV